MKSTRRAGRRRIALSASCLPFMPSGKTTSVNNKSTRECSSSSCSARGADFALHHPIAEFDQGPGAEVSQGVIILHDQNGLDATNDFAVTTGFCIIWVGQF